MTPEKHDPYDEVPAGNGGRVCVPVREAHDPSVNPEGEIYSGMTKRIARQGEGHNPVKGLPE